MKEYRDKDYEFVKQAFDDDGLKAPDSLSEDRIRQMLDRAGAGAEAEAGAGAAGPVRKDPRRRWLRPAIALAACAVLAICLIPLTRSGEPAGTEDLVASDAGLYTFKSSGQLDRQLRSLLEDQEDGQLYALDSEAAGSDTDMASGAAEDAEIVENDVPMAKSESAAGAAAEDGAAEAPAGSAAAAEGTSGTSGTSGAAGEAHSETYTQVEGIDEADIVKTDGKYIYYTSEMENQVLIARAKDGKAQRIAAVKCADTGAMVRDLYVSGDRLILIASDDYETTSEITGETWRTSTSVILYDITDRKDPKLVTQYSQTGEILSSRLIGERLCLVTNDYIYSYKRGRNVPYVRYGESGSTFEKLPLEDISCFPEQQSPAYTIIGLMDITSGEASRASVKTRAVLGGSDEIYCSGDHLYVTAQISSEEDREGGLYFGSRASETQILKVSLTGGEVKYLTSATVRGLLNDQFSMDESSGYFKVATTSRRSSGEDVNNLFVLDEEMKQVGSVQNFARNEHIEAVRYVKDKAYVITYEETDPLFIIDLSDPTDPVIEGHVKISGFSTLLVPADEDHLLGLGFSTETTEFGEATDGVKLALFDITDPAAPEVADSQSFPEMSSEVQYDHKALMAAPDGSYYAIPYELCKEVRVSAGEDETEYEEQYGVLVFSASDGKLQVLKDHEAKESVKRCIVIGEHLYVICSDDTIESFRLDQ